MIVLSTRIKPLLYKKANIIKLIGNAISSCVFSKKLLIYFSALDELKAKQFFNFKPLFLLQKIDNKKKKKTNREITVL